MLQLCIILLVVGVLALVLELLMPGFDSFISGIIGVLALVASAVLAVIFVPGGWFFVGINLTVLAVCAHFMYRYIKRGQFSGKIVLSEALVEDLPQVDHASLLGKEGKTITLLRPSGEADFNGTRVEVTTVGQMVAQGVNVRVVEVQQNKIIVNVVNGN